MKKIVILSGKGGVGKSSITASLATAFAKKYRIVCADCDVDASNLSILFGIDQKDYIEYIPLSTNQKAVVDTLKCIRCSKCIKACYFDAIEYNGPYPRVSDTGCEGCGACGLVCPKDAIKLVDIDNAYIGYAKTKKGFVIASAQLNPGSSGSGKVVSEVKKKAAELSKNAQFMITDSAAGIGCPVIASVTGNDLAIVVTEPTPSGYEDMKRAIEVIDHFRIKKGLIINKFDINEKISRRIEEYAEVNSIPLIGKMGFDKAFVDAMIKRVAIVNHDLKYKKIFDSLMERALRIL